MASFVSAPTDSQDIQALPAAGSEFPAPRRLCNADDLRPCVHRAAWRGRGLLVTWDQSSPLPRGLLFLRGHSLTPSESSPVRFEPHLNYSRESRGRRGIGRRGVKPRSPTPVARSQRAMPVGTKLGLPPRCSHVRNLLVCQLPAGDQQLLIVARLHTKPESLKHPSHEWVIRCQGCRHAAESFAPRHLHHA
jgi:hypothetical protein